MKCDVERLIESLVAAQVMEMQLKKQGQPEPPPPTVTLSRAFGSHGKEVAQLLADKLSTRCCDRDVLREVARRAHVDEELVATLDEHVAKTDHHWWERLLNRKDTFSQEDYYHQLIKVVLSITRAGGVILGRGAHHILGPNRAFHVRITGSPEVRARRVAQREQIDYQDALRKVREVDEERRLYIRVLYDQDIDQASQYDLVINSDHYSVADMVSMILHAMRLAGYPVETL